MMMLQVQHPLDLLLKKLIKEYVDEDDLKVPAVLAIFVAAIQRLSTSRRIS
jgi:hypothetical protein